MPVPRRINYGELPADAEFLEVAPGQYAIAREFMLTGATPKAIAAKLDTTASAVSKELFKIRQRLGCDDLGQLLYVLRAKQAVLVEVHDRRTNWLTRVSPAAAPAERNPGDRVHA